MTSLNVPVAMSSANGLVGTGFRSWYQVQPKAFFKGSMGRLSPCAWTSWCSRSSDRSFMVDPLSYFFLPHQRWFQTDLTSLVTFHHWTTWRNLLYKATLSTCVFSLAYLHSSPIVDMDVLVWHLVPSGGTEVGEMEVFHLINHWWPITSVISVRSPGV